MFLDNHTRDCLPLIINEQGVRRRTTMTLSPRRLARAPQLGLFLLKAAATHPCSSRRATHLVRKPGQIHPRNRMRWNNRHGSGRTCQWSVLKEHKFTLPVAALKVSANSIHDELGRGGYFPSSSGTSERLGGHTQKHCQTAAALGPAIVRACLVPATLLQAGLQPSAFRQSHREAF